MDLKFDRKTNRILSSTRDALLYTVILLVLLFIATGIAGAQPEDNCVFKVLACKGQNKINHELLQTGTCLRRGDTLEIGVQAYVGLIHSSGRPLEIKNAGKYVVKDIEKNVSTIGDDPVIHDLLYRQPSKKRSDAIGSGSEEIQVISHKHYTIFSPVLIMWCVDSTIKITEADRYRILVRNIFEDNLAIHVSEQPRFILDLSDPAFSDQPVTVMIELIRENKPVIRSRVIIFKDLPRHEKIKSESFDLRKKLTSTSSDLAFWSSVADECTAKELFNNAIYALDKAFQLSKNMAFKRKMNDIVNKYSDHRPPSCFEW